MASSKAISYTSKDSKTFTRTGFDFLMKIVDDPALMNHRMVEALLGQSKSSHAAPFFGFQHAHAGWSLHADEKDLGLVMKVKGPTKKDEVTIELFVKKIAGFSLLRNKFPRMVRFCVCLKYLQACTYVSKNMSPKTYFFLEFFLSVTGVAARGLQNARHRTRKLHEQEGLLAWRDASHCGGVSGH